INGEARPPELVAHMCHDEADDDGPEPAAPDGRHEGHVHSAALATVVRSVVLHKADRAAARFHDEALDGGPAKSEILLADLLVTGALTTPGLIHRGIVEERPKE